MQDISYLDRILSEVDETGEFPLVLVIPVYLIEEKGMIPVGPSLCEHKEHYHIDGESYRSLSISIGELVSSGRVRLAKYRSYGPNAPFKYLDEREALRHLSSRDNWKWGAEKDHYFLVKN